MTIQATRTTQTQDDRYPGPQLCRPSFCKCRRGPKTGAAALGAARLHQRRCGSAAIEPCQSKRAQEALDGVSLESLSAEVCGILGARHFRDAELAATEPLLDPEVRRGQVADLSEAFSLRDANSGRGIALQRESQGRDSEVGQDWEQAEALGHSSDHRCELCFS